MAQKERTSTSLNVIKYSNNMIKNLLMEKWKIKMYKIWKVKSTLNSKSIWDCLISIKLKWNLNLHPSSKTLKMSLMIILNSKINHLDMIILPLRVHQLLRLKIITLWKKLNNFLIKKFNQFQLNNSQIKRLSKFPLKKHSNSQTKKFNNSQIKNPNHHYHQSINYKHPKTNLSTMNNKIIKKK